MNQPTKEEKGITPRATDYSQWYLDVIDAAGLAEHSPVKGCMIIKPYGYALWELIQKDLDARFKNENVFRRCHQRRVQQQVQCARNAEADGTL